MQITDFTKEHIEAALELVKANYSEERKAVPSLPPIDNYPNPGYFLDKGPGVAATEDGRLLGYLTCIGPFERPWGTTFVKGIFASALTHAAVAENRGLIYQRLYQAAADKWAKAGAASHAIAFYAHDKAAIDAFFQYGFGMRLVESVRPVEPIDCPACPDYTFTELPGERRDQTLALKNVLIDHLAASPVFMPYDHLDSAKVTEQFERRDPRYFIAYHGDEMVAWLETTANGENFATYHPTMQNICGAACLPEHRGRGVYQNLLNYTMEILGKEGFTRLGVDFESANPTAYGFWSKYFTPYLCSLVRRIDEKAVVNPWVE